MGEMKKAYRAHVLVVPYPSQGHINPMLQLSKRLASKGLRATLAITNFIHQTMQPEVESIHFDTISDGYDKNGFADAESINSYLDSLESEGSKTLAQLIRKQESCGHPVDCIIYDAFLTWALDVAKQFGLVAAAFFTQPCGVNTIYYYIQRGLLPLPPSPLPVTTIPGLPPLYLQDMPSFVCVPGSYPAYFELVLNQYSNVDRADFILVNSFYKLEDKVVDAMSKDIRMVTIGPTIPSYYLDKRVENDKDYSLNLFDVDPSFTTTWLSDKPSGSVVYVAFGSMASLDEKQMEEMAWGLIDSGSYFLWVVRASEVSKLPRDMMHKAKGKGLIVGWSPQLEILSSEAVGCFFSHGGWNSTIEALSLGVPLVVMPQWTDQTTNAKFVEDVWKVGVRVKVDENGVVRREEVERCIKEVIGGGGTAELKKNALKWKELAKEALSHGGTSDNNIEALVSKLTTN